MNDFSANETIENKFISRQASYTHETQQQTINSLSQLSTQISDFEYSNILKNIITDSPKLAK